MTSTVGCGTGMRRCHAWGRHVKRWQQQLQSVMTTVEGSRPAMPRQSMVPEQHAGMADMRGGIRWHPGALKTQLSAARPAAVHVNAHLLLHDASDAGGGRGVQLRIDKPAAAGRRTAGRRNMSGHGRHEGHEQGHEQGHEPANKQGASQ